MDNFEVEFANLNEKRKTELQDKSRLVKAIEDIISKNSYMRD